jgi:type IV pilus assembly protein PilA
VRPLLGLVLVVTSGCNLVKGLPKDHECRSALRTIAGKEFAFYSETQRYSVHPAEIGWAPSQGNRYLYLFSKEGELTRRDELASPPHRESVGYGPDSKRRNVLLEDLLAKLPADLRAKVGISGTCPQCEVTIACVGNLDDDPEVDVWTISTADRPEAARGTPIHHLKDL